jgi:hypothetical protein
MNHSIPMHRTVIEKSPLVVVFDFGVIFVTVNPSANMNEIETEKMRFWKKATPSRLSLSPLGSRHLAHQS